MKSAESYSKQSNRVHRLFAKYGELMSLKELAVELKYSSTQAVLDANRKKLLPVSLTKMPNRRSLFAQTRSVVEFLDAAFPEEKRAEHDNSTHQLTEEEVKMT